MKPQRRAGLLVSSSLWTLACSGGTFPIEPEEDAPGVVSPDVCAGEASLPAEADERAGHLDTSFGDAGTGIVRSSFGADDDGGFYSLDIAGDDVLASGWGAGGLGGSTFRMIRLLPDGSADRGFAGGEQVTTSWNDTTADFAYATAIGHQSDGDVITMGWRPRFKGSSSNIVLVHHDADGSVHRDVFGPEGKLLLDLGGEEEVADGLVLPDDSIVVAGRRDGQLLVARITPQGTLDTSFAAPEGYWTARVGDASSGRAVEVDQQGRILVAGSVERHGQSDMLLIRFTAGGVPDASFGDDGMVIAGTLARNEHAVALSAGTRVVVAGDAGPVGADEFARARDFQLWAFLQDGAPDTPFGNQGVVSSVTTDHDDEAQDMVVLPDGRILVAGNAIADPNHILPMLARYTREGTPDHTMGDRGVVFLDLGEYGVLHAVAVCSAQQVLVAGGDVGMSPGPGTFGVVARVWM